MVLTPKEEAFRKYCESHSESIPSITRIGAEDNSELVERVYRNPELAGLRGIEQVYTDIKPRSAGRDVTEMDLVFFCKDGAYIVDCKVGYRAGNGEHAPLRRAHEFVAREFGFSPNLISVHQRQDGKLLVHRLRPSFKDVMMLAKRQP